MLLFLPLIVVNMLFILQVLTLEFHFQNTELTLKEVCYFSENKVGLLTGNLFFMVWSYPHSHCTPRTANDIAIFVQPSVVMLLFLFLQAIAVQHLLTTATSLNESADLYPSTSQSSAIQPGADWSQPLWKTVFILVFAGIMYTMYLVHVHLAQTELQQSSYTLYPFHQILGTTFLYSIPLFTSSRKRYVVIPLFFLYSYLFMLPILTGDPFFGLLDK